MQFFPVSGTGSATNSIENMIAAADKATTAAQSFKSVLSSFIEEGRTDYTGLPEGFSALEQQTGTLERETMGSFKQAMRKRQVPEAALDMLDQLSASGMPATIGRVFSVLGGNTRISAPLEGEDRTNFMQLTGKMGFTKTESEDLLGMLDDGRSMKAWQQIAEKIKGLGEGLDVGKTELSALVKGLDLPDSVQKKILDGFGKEQNLTLGPDQLQKLLGDAAQSLADREAAQKSAIVCMRDAMSEVLEQKKLKDKTGPVADTRGSRQTDRMEAVMQENVLKKAANIIDGKDSKDGKQGIAGQGDGTGAPAVDKLAARNNGQGAGNEQEAAPRERKDGQSRAERILATAKENTAGNGKADGKNSRAAETAVDKMMQRIDVAAANNQQTPAAGSNVPAQDLNSMARSFRQEIFSQVENGMLQNMQNGNRQLTLQLNPENLGTVTVILSVHQGEVKAHIRTENQESAAVLQEQMAELKASLEAQGLKVKELDVQTQLQDNSLANQWDGTREHNLMHDARERARMERLSKMRREAGAEDTTTAQTIQHKQAEQSGMHIVA